MNLSIVGPNGAGKSFLIRDLLRANPEVSPFSIANFPQSNSGRGTFKSVGALEKRSKDLVSKWGSCYKRELYLENRTYLIEEGFLTKLLAICPTDEQNAKEFEMQVMEYFPKILTIETGYVDRYIFVTISMEDWLRNRKYRNDLYLRKDLNGIRFQTQTRLLESYLKFYECKMPNSVLSREQILSII